MSLCSSPGHAKAAAPGVSFDTTHSLDLGSHSDMSNIARSTYLESFGRPLPVSLSTFLTSVL